ncbi:hypothetical protein LHJ74_15070 [Streptomyces sp. N2-109]|uniref:Lipoprotein n=1 Tax=Streptomyces gossypii TaxID=2883101 RepID=A0ABT2JU42_9ACTN|nr:hypothetical protein [Streptomyces gossypii]MCT2591213.1 hypothetical protein [Streptomyces gossypii]
MDASLPTRRTLIGVAAAAGVAALTGCAKDESGEKGKKQPSPTPSATDAARLGDAPPAADTASARSTDGAWRYTRLSPEHNASYHALAVTSRDDVWLLGTREKQSSAPFLEHWDGKRWSEPAPPDELKAGGRRSSCALAAGAPGEVWLAQRTGEDGQLAVFRRKGGSWQRLPDPPAVKGGRWSDGATEGAWCVASGAHLWASPYGKVVHWDGKRWDVPALPFPAAALAAAPAEDGTPRAWVAGSVDTECGQGECYPQPATARWADGAWQRLDTPSYHFPDPVPPEASATLDTLVHDPVSGRLWALGRHGFNHGEVDNEPDDESVVLTGDGAAWTKVRTPEFGRALSTAETVPDGTGGLLLDSRTRRTEDGKVHKLHDPGRLPEPSEVPKPKRRYDFKQPFDIATTRLIPGTRTVLAAGVVIFNNSSPTGNPPRRPVLARYDAGGKG